MKPRPERRAWHPCHLAIIRYDACELDSQHFEPAHWPLFAQLISPVSAKMADEVKVNPQPKRVKGEYMVNSFMKDA